MRWWRAGAALDRVCGSDFFFKKTALRDPMSDGDKRGKKAPRRMWSGLSACLFAEREENGAAMAGAEVVASEEEAELAAVKAEMAGLKKELEELNVGLRKYIVKALDQRNADEKAEIVRLSKKEEQLNERLIKLQEEKLKLMDVRAEKRSKIAPGIVCFASVNAP